MDTSEKKEYSKIYLLFNSVLIFLTASSYSGLSKQISAWGVLSQEISTQRLINENNKLGSIYLEAIEWSIPLLANQTSFFPDVKVMEENNKLKVENLKLKDSLKINSNILPMVNIDSLVLLISGLIHQIDSLNKDLINCEDSLEIYVLRLNRLSGENRDIRIGNSELNRHINRLLGRIDLFNRHQERWKQVDRRVANRIMADVNKNIGDSTYSHFIFETPIDKR